METSEKISYEYNIVKLINTKFNKLIKTEIIKVIKYIINTVYLFTNEKKNFDFLHYLSYLFFSDNTSEYGQIGLKQLENIDELNDLLIHSNIRELFVILNNFRKKIDCFMFELLIYYKNNPDIFLSKYPYFDQNYLNYIINFIENSFDININEFTNCYDSDFNIVNCDEDHKPFYRYYEDLNNDTYKKNFYNGICSLWCPYAVAIPNQSFIKLSWPNKIPDLVSKSLKKKVNDIKCVGDMLEIFPLTEQLSENELIHLQNKGKTPNDFNFSFCNSEPNRLNFLTEIKNRYDKLSISYTSGHTIIMLMICKYFKDINLDLIILGCIIWLVPYNHSINEIFLAGKQLGIVDGYNYKKTSFENINNLLEKMNLDRLDKVLLVAGKKTRKNKKKKEKKRKTRNLKQNNIKLL